MTDKKPKIAKLTTSRTFEAAHQLRFLPATHKCSRLHGHSYEVQIELEGYLDENGMLVDYADVHGVVDALDHDFLNGIAGLESPTTEVVVDYLAEKIFALTTRLGIVRVELFEGAHRHSAVAERVRAGWSNL